MWLELTCWSLATNRVIYSMDTGSSTVSRWLWHSIRACFISTRASALRPNADNTVDLEPGTICLRRQSLITYLQKPGRHGRQAYRFFGRCEDPEALGLTSFRLQEQQRPFREHQPNRDKDMELRRGDIYYIYIYIYIYIYMHVLIQVMVLAVPQRWVGDRV
jgi:hypothetical protein